MRVERYGSGEHAFLCLHGWNGNHATFAPLAKLVPPDVSLFCPDIPACDSLEAITDELEVLARGLGQPVRIVGNCSGALFGLLLAERIQVERLVMIDAFAYWPVYFRMFLAPVWGRFAYLSAFANPVGRAIANFSVARHRKESTNLTEGFRRVDHRATYRQLQLLSEIGPARRFRRIHASVDVAYGERSFAAVRKSAAMWKEILPQAELWELKGAGHLPLLEATEAVAQMIFEEKPCPVR